MLVSVNWCGMPFGTINTSPFDSCRAWPPLTEVPRSSSGPIGLAFTASPPVTIVAAESANNATTGGTLVPLLALGIPGGLTDSILLSALMIHNLQPGPLLYRNNPEIVNAGKQTFQSLCIPCHLASLKGKSENPGAVGPNLVDQAWIHGGTPKEIFNTVSKGVLVKGMPSWEPVLGQKKTAEVVAYVLSHHKKGEPITVEATLLPA